MANPKIYKSHQAKELDLLARKVEKSFKKINFINLEDEDLEKISKFNEAIDKIKMIYEKLILPLEEK